MKNVRFAVAVLVGFAGMRAASAATWSGYSTMLAGTTVAARPELAGDVVASQEITLHASGAMPDAVLHNYVVREAGAGTLDFYFQLTNTSAATENILQMGITGFDVGPGLDLDQLDPGTPYAQFFAARVGSGSGGMICTGSGTRGGGTFALDAGESTAPLFVHTNAAVFDTSGTFSFEGKMVPGGTFAPVMGGALPTPEPMSGALVAIGLAGLVLRRVRRV